MTKGILFDYGATIDTPGVHWSHIIAEGWRRAGIEADNEVFRQAYIVGERGVTKSVEPNWDFERTMLVKILYQMRVAQQAGLVTMSQILPTARLIARYCVESARRNIESVRPVLESLSERYPIGIVSNYYGNLEAVLAGFGIRQYFCEVLDSAVVGRRKPDSFLYDLGATVLGFQPAEVLVIGDSLEKDILPAASLGCRTAWLKGRGWNDEEEKSIVVPSDTIVIGNLNELIDKCVL